MKHRIWNWYWLYPISVVWLAFGIGIGKARQYRLVLSQPPPVASRFRALPLGITLNRSLLPPSLSISHLDPIQSSRISLLLSLTSTPSNLREEEWRAEHAAPAGAGAAPCAPAASAHGSPRRGWGGRAAARMPASSSEPWRRSGGWRAPPRWVQGKKWGCRDGCQFLFSLHPDMN